MKTQFKPEQYSPSAEDHRKCIETQRNYHRNNAYYKGKDIDGEHCESYPYYNKWVKALENDPDYIAKVEKRLDRELGINRIF